MRIFDSHPLFNTADKSLQTSNLYKIVHYTFDDLDIDAKAPYYPKDVEQWKKQYAVFNEQLAQQIVQDFQRLRQGCLELLVHCTMGVSRSPAVALGFERDIPSEE